MSGSTYSVPDRVTLPRNSDGVFTEIAGTYDFINKVLSFGQEQNWRRRAIAELQGSQLLDLGSGTGAALPALAGYQVVGLDPEAAMLRISPIRNKVVGYGESLPFPDASFDAVFSAYVFRNLTSVDDTLAEIHRVLKPGGKAAIVDLGRPKNRWLAKLHRAGSALVLPVIGALVGGRESYRYLHRSLDKLPPAEELFSGGPLSVEKIWRMGMFGFVYGVVLVK